MKKITVVFCTMPESTPAKCLEKIKVRDLKLCMAQDTCPASINCQFKHKVKYIEEINK